MVKYISTITEIVGKRRPITNESSCRLHPHK